MCDWELPETTTKRVTLEEKNVGFAGVTRDGSGDADAKCAHHQRNLYRDVIN